jgi:alkyl hydroperoxide reductase subunit F
MNKRDPVCGMEVTSEEFTLNYQGKKYYFCSKGCMNNFENHPMNSVISDNYDLVIIGAGPAGLTAAVYAAIQKINTFLITKNIGGQAIESSNVKNYLGFDFISGKELVNKFEHQFLHKHYLKHKIDEVLKISKTGNGFEIITVKGEKIGTKSIIIASGMKSRKLGIPGEQSLLRRGVSYSMVQDMDLFNDMDVVVIGGGNSGIQTTNDLKGIAKQISLISDLELSGDAEEIANIRKANNIRILKYHTVTEIFGKERVEGVMVRSKSDSRTERIPCSGVFIQIGFMPNTEFCRDLLDLNSKGEIKVNKDCSTGVEGIFACGDVTDLREKRIIIAAGDGAKAALKARKFLLNH